MSLAINLFHRVLMVFSAVRGFYIASAGRVGYFATPSSLYPRLLISDGLQKKPHGVPNLQQALSLFTTLQSLVSNMRFLLILLHLAVAFALAIVEQTTITNEVPKIILVELTDGTQQV